MDELLCVRGMSAAISGEETAAAAGAGAGAGAKTVIGEDRLREWNSLRPFLFFVILVRKNQNNN